MKALEKCTSRSLFRLYELVGIVRNELESLQWQFSDNAMTKETEIARELKDRARSLRGDIAKLRDSLTHVKG